MARSNGPASQSGGWPPAGRPAGADQEPQIQGRAPRQPHLIQPPVQQPQQPYPYPEDPRYAQGYAQYDDVPSTGGYAHGEPQASQPAYPPRTQTAPPQAPPYAPQFDPYLPAAQGYAPQPPTQPRQPAYPPESALSQLSTGRSRAGLGEFAPPPPADSRTRGYDQWQAQPQSPSYGGGEARDFDLGSYHPQTAEAATRAYPGAPSELDPRQPQAYGQEPTFSAQPARYPDNGYGYAGQQGYEAVPQEQFSNAPGYGQQGEADAYADDARLDGEQAGEGQGEEYDEEEQEPRGRKWLQVAAALLLAVGVGGGLAYGYQKFFRASGVQVATPVVKGDGAPSKVKPSDPGGKQFGNRDSKMMDRLSTGSSGSATGASSDSAGSDSEGGTKRVQTIAIGRDGSMAPPTASAAPQQDGMAPRPSVSVPGLTVVDGFGSRPQPRPAPPATAGVQPPGTAPAQQPIVVSPPASPAAKPIVVARAAPNTPTAADVEEAAATAAQPVRPAAATTAALPKTPVPKKTPAVAATGAGYVAVLASVPVSGSSQKDSLRQFVDMQSKYGTALQGRTPDVQEVDLGAKGKYHRLLAGPPGSREAASAVCSQLKAAGYSGCWVISY